MSALLRQNALFIDLLRDYFESRATLGKVSALLLIIFVGAILVIEANIQGLLGPDLSAALPTTHLAAIEVVFTVLLIYEALGLLLSISESISISVGKQFEILSLILLRNTFKLVSHFPEPMTWQGIERYMPEMGSSIAAAVALFFLTHVFYGVSRQYRGSRESSELEGFIHAKKLLTSLLLVGFVLIIARNTYEWGFLGEKENIFGEFYTLLIFFDIAMVLISLRYHSGYGISFRNSAFAVSTVTIKITLVAPAYYSAVMGVCAMLIAIAASWIYSRFMAVGVR